MSRFLTVLTIAVSVACFAASRAASAGPITPDAFGPTAVVETYSNLSLQPTNPTPVEIGGNDYTTVSTKLRWGDFGGICYGATGDCVGTDQVVDAFIIDLATPVALAGGYLALDDWTALFFAIVDSQFVLLGSINGKVPDPGTMAFAGWKSDKELIARVEFQDNSQDRAILLLDNFTTEVGNAVTIPEPGSLALVALSLFGLALARRRRPSI
jgi:hypothetical protein